MDDLAFLVYHSVGLNIIWSISHIFFHRILSQLSVAWTPKGQERALLFLDKKKPKSRLQFHNLKSTSQD